MQDVSHTSSVATGICAPTPAGPAAQALKRDTGSMATKIRWGDTLDDDEAVVQMPQGSVTGPDERGVTTTVEYKRNDKGEIMKITTRVKTSRIQRKVYKVCHPRSAKLPHDLKGCRRGPCRRLHGGAMPPRHPRAAGVLCNSLTAACFIGVTACRWPMCCTLDQHLQPERRARNSSG